MREEALNRAPYISLDQGGAVPVPSSSYRLFEQAMRQRKQIVCMYDSYLRELCPIVLGHSQEQEKAVTYQFGGQSKSGLPPGGEWRCPWLSKVGAAQLVMDRGGAGPAIPGPKAALRSSTSM